MIYFWAELEIVRLKVEDFTPPTLAQVKQFIDVLDQAEARHTIRETPTALYTTAVFKITKRVGKAVAVHCAAGKGRTGTCIACYFVRRFGHTASQAIEYVRCLRPGSVETSEQAALVFEFESHLQRDSQASTSRK